MENYPKITIITTVLNRVTRLEKSFSSLFAQNYPNLEYLVFDGGSTDGTVELIKKYANKITYWESKADQGPGDALNRGIKKATGELIGFLHSDDWYIDNILFKIAECYQRNPDCDVISCGWKLVAQKQNSYVDKYAQRGKQLAINLNTVLKYGPATCSRFVTPALYKKMGYLKCFSNNGKYLDSHDLEFYLELSQEQINHEIVNDIGYMALKHQNSRTHNCNFKIKQQLYKHNIRIVAKKIKDSQYNKTVIFYLCKEVVKLFIVTIAVKIYHLKKLHA